jgi:thiol peroxidase
MNPKTKILLIVTAAAVLSVVTTLVPAQSVDTAEILRADVVTMKGNPLTLRGPETKVNEKAPDFTLIDRKMQPVSLADYAGKVRIITVFPSVDTAVCPLQVRRFNEVASRLDDVQILAVSVDLPFALDRFCAAEGIDNLVTLSDHRTTDFGLKYGFLIDEMRLLARGTVIIDKAGVVRYVEYVGEITEEPDYDQAIEAARALLGET